MLWRPIIKPSSSWRRTSFAGARRPATGFTFPYQGNGDGRHQNAPADGRRHAPVYVTEQLPDGRRQLEPEVSFTDMRQFSDMRQSAAYHGGVQHPHRQYPHVAVGPPGGHDYLRQQSRDGPQQYGLGRVVQPAFPTDQSAVPQHGYSPLTPVHTPSLPARHDPAAEHLQWLQKQYDAERVSATRDPALLTSLMQQMEETRNAVLGIVTPKKTDSKSGQDESNGSPEYKLGGASVLDASETSLPGSPPMT